jgi:membrane protein DedA with SNARE-associated domain
MRRHPRLASLLLAAVPNPVFDFAGLLAGTSNVPVRKFLPYTFMGRVGYGLVVTAATRTLAGVVS